MRFSKAKVQRGKIFTSTISNRLAKSIDKLEKQGWKNLSETWQAFLPR